MQKACAVNCFFLSSRLQKLLELDFTIILNAEIISLNKFSSFTNVGGEHFKMAYMWMDGCALWAVGLDPLLAFGL